MAVTQFQVRRREPYAGGKSFGDVGTFTRLDGTLTFAFDPELEANAGIVDLDLAPRIDGRVRSSADVTLVVPDDPSRANGTLILDVPNRGRSLTCRSLNLAGPAALLDAFAPGDGFTFRHGFGLASVAWQSDVDPIPGALTCELPVAGTHAMPVVGETQVELRPLRNSTETPLSFLMNVPYDPVDPGEPGARLLTLESEHGPQTEIPRSEWRFAAGDKVSRATSRVVVLDRGFEAGRSYLLIYTVRNPTVTGAGLLGLRDAAAFFRSGARGTLPGPFQRVVGLGVSQTGRLLRHLLSLGLTNSEVGDQALDGLLIHIAGGLRGEFNHRFALPSQITAPSFGHLFPFALGPALDPATGVRAGLFDVPQARGTVPRVVSLNTSWEYWRGDAALVHVDPGGSFDLEEHPNERVYALAGTQHVAGFVPQATSMPPPMQDRSARYGINVVDPAPLLRAAMLNLKAWIRGDADPPPSCHPRVSDGTAVERQAVLERFKGVTGIEPPDPDRLPDIRPLDLGPGAARGIGTYPPAAGRPFAALVSDVDDDLNEVAGIRLPDVTVPVGSHTGWNTQDPACGDPGRTPMFLGLTRFFARTDAERDPSDPRPSLAARYGDRAGYETRVRSAAAELARSRYLLEEDLDLVVANCLARYDEALRVGAANPPR